MSRREARFAGAVWAGIYYPNFVENEIDDCEECERYRHREQSAVDFFDRFTLDPLIEAKPGENRQYAERGD